MDVRGGLPVWLIPANRKTATKGVFFAPPHWMVPDGAEIIAVGKHDVFPIHGIAWVSYRNEVIVGIEAPMAEVGRILLVRIWDREQSYPSHEAILKSYDETRAVAIVETDQPYGGRPIAGIAMISCLFDWEEQ
jgi:hypothetical protein